MATLRDVVTVLDELYDPRWADDWDAVGTVAGDPDAVVAKILFAVDPVQAVVDEAVAWGADLVVTHHPLYLKGVTSVAATTPKGAVLHTLLTHGIALHTCHTNADSPALGVSESMALALGLTEVRPLEPDAADPLDKWVTFVPRGDVEKVAAAMTDAGAGAIGLYDSCTFRSSGTGTFRPRDGAQPAVGHVGDLERVDETKLEMVATRAVRAQVLHALRSVHPYEEPAFDLLELAATASENRGSGRIGVLPETMTLGSFAELVTRRLPAHRSATRVAGDLDRPVRTVALCGGSGDFLLSTADALGADAYVTSDLRHHPVSEHLERPGACGVIDVPHWAAEWTWLPVAAREVVARAGDTVEARISTLVTDPWSATVIPSTRSTP